MRRADDAPSALEIGAYLDELLQTTQVPDYPNALNGLQLASFGLVRRIALAVDFCSQVVDAAIAADAQLLVVHHGMFWGGTQRIVGETHRRLARLLEHDIAVYSAHLPLDVHPEAGNNVLLARALGLAPAGGFARFKTMEIGVSGESDLATTELTERCREFARAHGGTVIVGPHAPERRTRRWAICTGAGASSDTLAEARDRGIDTLIVGEGPHHTAVLARDENILIIYAGHYATETLGVQALGERLRGRWPVETRFIDAPTGL